jgi:4-amino-4-deoxy-L-arabinose transferase-like glycosyltransferase
MNSITQAQLQSSSGSSRVRGRSGWPPRAIILLLWLAVYLPGLFHPPLLDDADSVHAEAAREMVLTHDWVTLHINGVRYLEKAPLMYWGMAASFKLFGVAEWSARLPLALGTLGLLWAAYTVGRRVYGNRAGLYAAVILGTGFGLYIFTRILIPDVLVGLWLTLGFLFFLDTLHVERPSRLNCWGFAAAAALNVLTKGLIGLVFPVGAVVIFLVLTGNLRHLLRLRLFSSTVVFLGIAAPWHVLAELRNPGVPGVVHGFLWFYFVNEQFLRYLNERVPRDYDTVPLLVFWGLFVAWLLPWSVFAVPAAREALHSERIREAPAGLVARWRAFALRVKDDPQQRATLLFVIWTLLIVVFFSFSTRQEYYTIPAVPGLALLIAGWMQKEEDAPRNSRMRFWGRISSGFLLGLGVVVFAAAMYFLYFSHTPPPGYDLADLLTKNPDKYALSFGHIFDLTPEALGAFRVPLLGFGVAMLGGTAMNWWLRRRSKVAAANLALAVMMVGVLSCVHLGLVEFSPILTSKKLALELKPLLRPGDIMVINAEYEPGSTLNFYTGEPVHVMRKFGNLWYGSFWPDTPKIYEDEQSLGRLWAGPARVFLWSDEANPKVLEGKKYWEMDHYGGKYIFVNQPVDGTKRLGQGRW